MIQNFESLSMNNNKKNKGSDDNMILEKMEQVKQDFEAVQAEIKAEEESMKKSQERISQLVGHQQQLQGSYGTLVDLGISQGILDEQGNPIEQEASPETPKKETKK